MKRPPEEIGMYTPLDHFRGIADCLKLAVLDLGGKASLQPYSKQFRKFTKQLVKETQDSVAEAETYLHTATRLKDAKIQQQQQEILGLKEQLGKGRENLLQLRGAGLAAEVQRDIKEYLEDVEIQEAKIDGVFNKKNEVSPAYDEQARAS